MSRVDGRRSLQGCHRLPGKRKKSRSRLSVVSYCKTYRPFAVLTQTGFVVEVRIREMKVAVVLPVVELDCDSVVFLLIDRPYEACQVQACTGQHSRFAIG